MRIFNSVEQKASVGMINDSHPLQSSMTSVHFGDSLASASSTRRLLSTIFNGFCKIWKGIVSFFKCLVSFGNNKPLTHPKKGFLDPNTIKEECRLAL